MKLPPCGGNAFKRLRPRAASHGRPGLPWSFEGDCCPSFGRDRRASKHLASRSFLPQPLLGRRGPRPLARASIARLGTLSTAVKRPRPAPRPETCRKAADLVDLAGPLSRNARSGAVAFARPFPPWPPIRWLCLAPDRISRNRPPAVRPGGMSKRGQPCACQQRPPDRDWRGSRKSIPERLPLFDDLAVITSPTNLPPARQLATTGRRSWVMIH